MGDRAGSAGRVAALALAGVATGAGLVWIISKLSLGGPGTLFGASRDQEDALAEAVVAAARDGASGTRPRGWVRALLA